MFRKLIHAVIRHPRLAFILTALITVGALSQYPRIKVDTDPENMLPSNAPVRVFHNQVKKEFAIYDLIVLGIINERHPDGVFNAKTLEKVYQITRQIEQIPGVIAPEIIALSTKDNIRQAGLGAVSFDWLMPRPPQDRRESLQIRQEALNHPFFRGTVVSQNGRAMCLYIPIKSKDISYEVAQQIRKIYQGYSGDEEFLITGLPVANDQFGVEMFKQMALSAPLAGVVIFLLMLFFFKSALLILAPMIVAIVTVLMTMGLLIGFGFPVHIMSSMIPIFLMPIAVLDSVHILSEFFDKYPRFRDKRQTILHVLDELFMPMLFTSLTSAVGFFSLSFSPIPPVQVFGVFVAVGVALAWVLTITLIPAYIMLLNERSFRSFAGHTHDEGSPFLTKFLKAIRRFSAQRFKIILTLTVLVVVISVYGISRIRVNDNPVRWFTASHPIRVADRILNKHFAGTYQAYLVLTAANSGEDLFIRPEMLRYVETLQQKMVETNLVGKSMTLTDIVKKIYYELLGGDKSKNVIPGTRQAVAQALISFENSHKPDDLWHFTTPDYSKLNIWVQLKSGDNRDMDRVVRIVNDYFRDHPPPYPLEKRWAGLTYVNVIWQNNMVGGMLKNFIGSYVIVLFMMLFLFRSPVKALISMIPLTVTILFIYSLLGFFGKDYDMPVAVLSALTLGLSIDFAIHFIQRATEIYETNTSWRLTAKEMFGGPGRAIVRNALVIAIGFLPLLAAPLVPYKTVGFFMFMIMAVSSVATLIILPALVTVNPSGIFRKIEKGVLCQCRQCALVGFFVAAAVAYVLWGYTAVKRWPMTLFTIGVIVVFSGLCNLVSRHRVCLTDKDEDEGLRKKGARR